MRPEEPGDVEMLRLRYPEGAHDAEALLIDPLKGGLFVVIKEEKRARFYVGCRARLEGGEDVMMTLVGEVAFPKVSAGDISRDGQAIVLRHEHATLVWTRGQGETIANALQHRPDPGAVVGPPDEPNGESIAWRPDGQG